MYSVDIHPIKGLTDIYKSSNGENSKGLDSIFQGNIISLNELIGYIELTDSNEIWPNHLLSIKKRNFKEFAIILDFFT